VTWDPNSPAARNATGGALNVIEDNSHERIPLNASEIRSGSATYRPIGDDITFRLEMATGDTVATETYRVFMKEAAIPMRVPVPRPQATPAKPADTPKPVEASPKTAEAPKPADAPKPTETPKPEVPDVATEVIHRVSPEIGEGIRPRISAPTPVDVRVHINRDGHVTTAAAIQHGDGLVDYLAARAVAAARQWTFTPAQHGGKPIESTRVIHFVFEQ
jgi:outer membrane biosynthesis protein TonB